MTEAKRKKLLAILDRYVAAYARGGLDGDEHRFAHRVYRALGGGTLGFYARLWETPCAHCTAAGSSPVRVETPLFEVIVPCCTKCVIRGRGDRIMVP